MIQPHGGTLINRELPKVEKDRLISQVEEFEKIQVDSETWKVIKNIAFGVFSPLEGFMNENDILPRMIKDHCKIERLLDGFEKNIDNKNILKYFHKFEWELEKHIFLEEKAIFMEYKPNDVAEGYKMLPELTRQHNYILNQLNNWSRDINIHKNIEGFFDFKKILIRHKKFEEENVYPKLDETLSDDQKKRVVDKIDEFVEKLEEVEIES